MTDPSWGLALVRAVLVQDADVVVLTAGMSEDAREAAVAVAAGCAAYLRLAGKPERVAGQIDEVLKMWPDLDYPQM